MSRNSETILRNINFAILLTGFCVTAYIMSDQTVFDDFWQALAYTGPFAWAQAPYLILMIANLFRLFNKITLLVVSGIITIFGIAVLVDGLYVHIDAQNALLFLIVPVYQAGAAVIGIILALVFGRIKSARKSAS